MIPRFKLVTAALGFVVAAGPIGEAYAATVVRSVTTHTLAGTRTVKVITHRPGRIVLATRFVRHARLYRPLVLARAPVVTRKVVRVTRGPHVARRVVTRTVIR